MRGGCLLPIPVHSVKGDRNRWESSSGFQTHPLKEKSGEKTNSGICGVWGTKKNFLHSVYRYLCVHEQRKAGWSDNLPMVPHGDFIDVAFPHVQPPPASPSHAWIAGMRVEGPRNWWICMSLGIVFPGLVTALQKWTAVKEEDKSMRHHHLANILKSALREMLVLCFWERLRNPSICVITPLTWIGRWFHSTKFNWCNLKWKFGGGKHSVILPLEELVKKETTKQPFCAISYLPKPTQ